MWQMLCPAPPPGPAGPGGPGRAFAPVRVRLVRWGHGDSVVPDRGRARRGRPRPVHPAQAGRCAAGFARQPRRRRPGGLRIRPAGGPRRPGARARRGPDGRLGERAPHRRLAGRLAAAGKHPRGRGAALAARPGLRRRGRVGARGASGAGRTVAQGVAARRPEGRGWRAGARGAAGAAGVAQLGRGRLAGPPDHPGGGPGGVRPGGAAGARRPGPVHHGAGGGAGARVLRGGVRRAVGEGHRRGSRRTWARTWPR